MITEERISTFISSFDTGNTSFLNELEEFAIKTNVPVIRSSDAESVKAASCNEAA